MRRPNRLVWRQVEPILDALVGQALQSGVVACVQGSTGRYRRVRLGRPALGNKFPQPPDEQSKQAGHASDGVCCFSHWITGTSMPPKRHPTCRSQQSQPRFLDHAQESRISEAAARGSLRGAPSPRRASAEAGQQRRPSRGAPASRPAAPVAHAHAAGLPARASHVSGAASPRASSAAVHRMRPASPAQSGSPDAVSADWSGSSAIAAVPGTGSLTAPGRRTRDAAADAHPGSPRRLDSAADLDSIPSPSAHPTPEQPLEAAVEPAVHSDAVAAYAAGRDDGKQEPSDAASALGPALERPRTQSPDGSEDSWGTANTAAIAEEQRAAAARETEEAAALERCNLRFCPAASDVGAAAAAASPESACSPRAELAAAAGGASEGAAAGPSSAIAAELLPQQLSGRPDFRGDASGDGEAESRRPAASPSESGPALEQPLAAPPGLWSGDEAAESDQSVGPPAEAGDPAAVLGHRPVDPALSSEAAVSPAAAIDSSWLEADAASEAAHAAAPATTERSSMDQDQVAEQQEAGSSGQDAAADSEADVRAAAAAAVTGEFGEAGASVLRDAVSASVPLQGDVSNLPDHTVEGKDIRDNGSSSRSSSRRSSGGGRLASGTGMIAEADATFSTGASESLAAAAPTQAVWRVIGEPVSQNLESPPASQQSPAGQAPDDDSCDAGAAGGPALDDPASQQSAPGQVPDESCGAAGNAEEVALDDDPAEVQPPETGSDVAALSASDSTAAVKEEPYLGDMSAVAQSLETEAIVATLSAPRRAVAAEADPALNDESAAAQLLKSESQAATLPAARHAVAVEANPALDDESAAAQPRTTERNAATLPAPRHAVAVEADPVLNDESAAAQPLETEGIVATLPAARHAVAVEADPALDDQSAAAQPPQMMSGEATLPASGDSVAAEEAAEPPLERLPSIASDRASAETAAADAPASQLEADGPADAAEVQPSLGPSPWFIPNGALEPGAQRISVDFDGAPTPGGDDAEASQELTASSSKVDPAAVSSRSSPTEKAAVPLQPDSYGASADVEAAATGVGGSSRGAAGLTCGRDTADEGSANKPDRGVSFAPAAQQDAAAANKRCSADSAPEIIPAPEIAPADDPAHLISRQPAAAEVTVGRPPPAAGDAGHLTPPRAPPGGTTPRASSTAGGSSRRVPRSLLRPTAWLGDVISVIAVAQYSLCHCCPSALVYRSQAVLKMALLQEPLSYSRSLSCARLPQRQAVK